MVIDLFADRNALQKENRQLTQELQRVISELHRTNLLFNEVTDPYETESLIYRMKELELHYSFLIKKAKLDKIVNTEYSGDKLL